MNASLSIAIVLGSVREGRFGGCVLEWFAERAMARPEIATVVLDPREFAIPIFSDPHPPAVRAPAHPQAVRWAQSIDAADGVVFITPEYNHGVPGVLKNLLDYGGKEWNRKPAAFIGYGSLGAGRAVQSLRHTAIALQMAPLYRAVHLAGSDFLAARESRQLARSGPLCRAADLLLQDLIWWSNALRTARLAAPNP